MAGREWDNRASQQGSGHYAGFKGHFDKDNPGVFVFESKDERDRYQIATYGRVRNGWREDDDPTDGRPTIAPGACRCRGCREYGGEFWRDGSDRLSYEHAVESWPKRPDEGALTYIARIAGIVAQRKLAQPAKNIPKPDRLSPVEFHERQVELEVQGIAIKAGAKLTHEFPDMPAVEQVEQVEEREEA